MEDEHFDSEHEQADEHPDEIYGAFVYRSDDWRQDLNNSQRNLFVQFFPGQSPFKVCKDWTITFQDKSGVDIPSEDDVAYDSFPITPVMTRKVRTH